MALSDDTAALKRRTILCTVGRETAELLSTDIKARFGIDDAIAFNANALALDDCISDYFERVARFKNRHDFADGDRINYSKIAGLTALVFLERKPGDLFRFDDAVRGSVYAPLALPVFIYRVIAAILMLDLPRVDRDVENDLMRCIVQHPDIKADPDWLFWSLRVLQIAYGDPDLGRDG